MDMSLVESVLRDIVLLRFGIIEFRQQIAISCDENLKIFVLNYAIQDYFFVQSKMIGNLFKSIFFDFICHKAIDEVNFNLDTCSFNLFISLVSK